MDALLQKIEAAGLLVNNLFQLGDGTWQANLRRRKPAPNDDSRDEFAHEFGVGQTMEVALKAALKASGVK